MVGPNNDTGKINKIRIKALSKEWNHLGTSVSRHDGCESREAKSAVIRFLKDLERTLAKICSDQRQVDL